MEAIQPIPTNIDPEFELTGEFRVPVGSESWAHADSSRRTVHSVKSGSSPNFGTYAGRRWILRKKVLPPKPSEAWLQRHNVELTGECRIPEAGEQVVSWNGVAGIEDSYIVDWKEGQSKYLELSGPGSVRWILRKKTEPKEEKFLVMVLSRDGKPEYYLAPGTGLTDRREDAHQYSLADALKCIGCPNYIKKLFITRA